MYITKVQYTVKPEYAETNKANIARVMDEVRKMNHPGFKYACYVMEDGRSFMHFCQAESKEINDLLFTLESFKRFREELNASEPEVKPKTKHPTLVAAGYEIF